MTIIRKLLGFERRVSNVPVVVEQRRDQLSVDVALAAQQNNQAAIRVRETLSQLLASTDQTGRLKR